MRELVNCRELGHLGIDVEWDKQHASTFVRRSFRVAQFNGFRLNLGPFSWNAKPFGHEWSHLLCGKHILLGSRLVIRNVGDVDRWLIEALIVANHKERRSLPERPECTLGNDFIGSTHPLLGSQASCLAIAYQDCRCALAGVAKLYPQLRLHFASFP